MTNIHMIVVFGIVLFLSKIVYNIFWHPLRSYPGPWYAKASRLWYCFHVLKGTLAYDVKNLHDKYGDVVQIAPGELSYINPEAWQEIYGRNLRKSPQGGTKLVWFSKDPIFYSGIAPDLHTLVDTDGDRYAAQKRALASGFSKKAVFA